MWKFVVALVACIFANLCQAQSLREQMHEEIVATRLKLVEMVRADEVRSERVSRLVQKMNLHDVQVIVAGPSCDEIGMYFPGVIVLSSRLLKEEDEVLAFVLAHEYGHHIARHWASALDGALALAQSRQAANVPGVYSALREVVDQEASYQNEFEADALAKHLLQYNNLWDPDAAFRVLQGIANPAPSVTHPGSVQRLQALGVM